MRNILLLMLYNKSFKSNMMNKLGTLLEKIYDIQETMSNIRRMKLQNMKEVTFI